MTKFHAHHTQKRLELRSLGVLILLFFLISCSATSSGPKPDWVDHQSKKYPENRYLLGVGSGDDEQSAEMNALSAIARIFQVAVKQSQTEISNSLTTKTGDDTQSQWEVQFNEVTELSTQKTLEGAQIVESWVDPAQTVHKLAVLDRLKTALILEERIEELDKAVNRDVNTIRRSGDKLQVARSYYRSIQMMMKRDVYNSDLRIVNPTGQGNEFKVSLNSTSSDLRTFLAQELNMAIEITGPNSEKVKTALVESLTKSGFSVLGQTSNNPPNIIIKGELQFKNLDMPSSNKFVRWQADFHLVNQIDGKEFGSLQRRGREAHVSYEAAEQRALRLLIKQVNQKLSQEIFAFVFGSEKVN
jgi:hypothetical protein